MLETILIGACVGLVVGLAFELVIQTIKRILS